MIQPRTPRVAYTKQDTSTKSNIAQERKLRKPRCAFAAVFLITVGFSSASRGFALSRVTVDRDDYVYPSLKTPCTFFQRMGVDPGHQDAIALRLGMRVTYSGESFHYLGKASITCPSGLGSSDEYIHVRDSHGRQGWIYLWALQEAPDV
jgi:hypothetical protein